MDIDNFSNYERKDKCVYIPCIRKLDNSGKYNGYTPVCSGNGYSSYEKALSFLYEWVDNQKKHDDHYRDNKWFRQIYDYDNIKILRRETVTYTLDVWEGE